MKTTKYINVLALVCTIAAAGSCSDDFLQKDSLTTVSSSTFWKTETDALNGLAACYDGLQSSYLYNGGPWECGPLNMDCMTDNGGHFNWSGWMAGYDICNGTHGPSSWLVGSYWSANYEVIKRCNVLIKNIDNVDMDEALKEQYKAEATVLRALMYINLTMTYHDVPYLKAPLTLSEAEVGKTSRTEIVEDVITDLKAAAAVLPSAAPSLGRITQGAALSLLGRIALYNEKWSEAISAYEAVQKLGYSLHPDYAELFSTRGQESGEIIFPVRFEGPGVDEGCSFAAHWNTPLEAMNGTVDLADAFYKTDGTPYTAQDACASADGAPDLWSPNSARYADRDPRMTVTLFIPGVSTWGASTALYGGAAASLSTIYVMKYFDNGNIPDGDSWDWGQDFYVIRYAEVLLSLAEAYIESNTNLSTAESLISEVRERAGMPSVAAAEGSGLSQSQLREIVRHERRVETAFEGLRLFDLYRWNILQEAKDRINAEKAAYNFAYEDRLYRDEREYVWPLPQSEVDNNVNLEQNSLWK